MEWTEPGLAAIDPIPSAIVDLTSYLQVDFDTPATAIGGVARLKFLPGKAGDIQPVSVFVYYVTPAYAVPPVAQRSTDWFFADHPGITKVFGSVVVSDVIAAGTAEFDVKVDGVVPGAHTIQVIYEYPDPAEAAAAAAVVPAPVLPARPNAPFRRP